MMTGEANATKLAREVAPSLKMFGRGYLKDRWDFWILAYGTPFVLNFSTGHF